jgi:hypothetical protein
MGVRKKCGEWREKSAGRGREGKKGRGGEAGKRIAPPAARLLEPTLDGTSATHQQQTMTLPAASPTAGFILFQSKAAFTTSSCFEKRSFEKSPFTSSVALSFYFVSASVLSGLPALRSAGSDAWTSFLNLTEPGRSPRSV